MIKNFSDIKEKNPGETFEVLDPFALDRLDQVLRVAAETETTRHEGDAVGHAFDRRIRGGVGLVHRACIVGAVAGGDKRRGPGTARR